MEEPSQIDSQVIDEREGAVLSPMIRENRDRWRCGHAFEACASGRLRIAPDRVVVSK